LQHAKYVAPWAGFVLEKQVLPGQVVTVEKNEIPLLTLVRSDKLNAVAWVAKSVADTVKLNSKIQVNVAGSHYSGEIKSLKDLPIPGLEFHRLF